MFRNGELNKEQVRKGKVGSKGGKTLLQSQGRVCAEEATPGVLPTAPWLHGCGTLHPDYNSPSSTLLATTSHFSEL